MLSLALHAGAVRLPRLWYQDIHNVPPSSQTVDPAPGNASLTFIIPAKLRPLMLIQTVLNLYGKAAHKERLFVHVVLYANDESSLRVIPLLKAISPNVVIRINRRVEVGYDAIEHLYQLGAEGINTTLQVVYADRAHVMTQGEVVHAGTGYRMSHVVMLISHVGVE